MRLLQEAGPLGPAARRLQLVRASQVVPGRPDHTALPRPPCLGVTPGRSGDARAFLVRQAAGFAARALWNRLASTEAVADFAAAAAATANVTVALPLAPDLAALAWEGADGQTLGTVWAWSCLAAATFRRVGRR